MSVPLFTGGLNSSRVAQALEHANAAQIESRASAARVLQDGQLAYRPGHLDPRRR